MRMHQLFTDGILSLSEFISPALRDAAGSRPVPALMASPVTVLCLGETMQAILLQGQMT